MLVDKQKILLMAPTGVAVINIHGANIEVDVRVMLTASIDLKDRLVNRQLGTVKHFNQNSINSLITIYVKLSWSEKNAH